MQNRLSAAWILAAALIAAPAFAQQDAGRADPFSALVGKRQTASERADRRGAVDRYVIASDERVFLFQSGDKLGRVKFLCGDGDQRIDCLIDAVNPAEEISLLTPARASRGDVLWRGSEGATLVRVAAYGGVTAFWPGDARGYAASKSFGEDPPLVLVAATVATARERAQRATALVSAKVGAPIVFEIGEAGEPQAEATVLADAVVRAASGVVRVAKDPTGARVVAARLQRVEFQTAPDPMLGIKKGVLTVGYNPRQDVAGRPSSAKVAKFLEDSL